MTNFTITITDEGVLAELAVLMEDVAGANLEEKFENHMIACLKGQLNANRKKAAEAAAAYTPITDEIS